MLTDSHYYTNGVESHVQIEPEDNNNNNHRNINSIQAVKEDECQEMEGEEESNTDKFHPTQSISSHTSTFSRNTGSFTTAKTNPNYGTTDNNEIDYKILGQPLPQLIDSDPASSSASIRTIRPNDKRLLNRFIEQQSIQNDPTFDNSSKPSSSSSTQQQKENKNEQEEQLTPPHNDIQAPLSWKSSGVIFKPPAARASFVASEQRYLGNDEDNEEDQNRVLKKDTLLCKKSFGLHGMNNQPTQYNASKEGKNQKEEWRQLQVELTSKTLSLYSSPPLIWPCRRLEHQVTLREHHNGLNPHHFNTFRQYTKNLRLYLHSPLDYTFCIQYPYKQSGNAYITLTFRARSMTLSQEWYLALYKVLPDQCKPVCSPWCEVNIPMMELQVRLPLVKILDTTSNNNKNDLRYDITLDSVKHAVLGILDKKENVTLSGDNSITHTNSSNMDIMIKKFKEEDLAMCWTRNNRTEWVYWKNSLLDKSRAINTVISPQHIEQTHRLELRPIEHTPNHVVFSDQKSMKEPQPVEGFLYRLTTFSGKHIPPGSLSRRRYYFASFDQFLFCISSIQNLKPPNEHCYEQALTDDMYTATISPFTEEGDNNLASHELERRMQLITEASRVIDLTEISYVQRSFCGEGDEDSSHHCRISNSNNHSPDPEILDTVSHRTSSLPETMLRVQQQQLEQQRKSTPVLEIIMQNGLVIRLRADSSEACDAWVQHLTNLSFYWRVRKEAQQKIIAKHHYGDMFTEEFRYTLTHQEKGYDFNKTPNVDTRIWSICCFEQCRDIVKSGVMYFQPRSRGTFSQKIFILTANGWLIYYNIYDRGPSLCQPIRDAIHADVHERKDMVDITGCYVYSSPSPRRPTRIFPDGIAAPDHNDDSLFSIWKPQTRRIFSPKRQRFQVYKHQHHFFQEEGETWQFLAKNRHEKQSWIWAFNIVIERLLRNNGSLV
ncbi:hypothetical protein INT45_005736 [Circinella minor]|uniref:PH domain-containing protein n=1 Tax=Circinella minor TaxID=1195481 RepID=A0A8H7SEE7_9FUNG|nr:hypothetical protein INT45_005736 [Circinella minor]